MNQADTVPPSTEADSGAAEFETEVRLQGEGRARWDRLMRLLEERWSAGEE